MIDIDTSAPHLPFMAHIGRRLDTREHILAATRTALVQEGYEKITTRRIAEVAGVNIATLHYHFGSKEALLHAAMRYALAQTEERMRQAVAGADSFADAIRRAFACIWQMMQERPGILRFDLAVRGFRDAAANTEAQTVYAAYRRIVRDLLERHTKSDVQWAEGMTPELLAEYMTVAVDGVVFQHTINGNNDAARAMLTLIERHILTLVQEAPEGGIK